MKAFIPEIGSKLKIEKDWTFDLYLESRNSDIYYSADDKGNPDWRRSELGSYKRILPKGTEVIIDRIYVRKNASDYSSISMYITKTTDKNILKNKPKGIPFSKIKEKHYGRFWVKLTDFNRASFEVIDDVSLKGKPTLVKGEPITLKRFKTMGKNRNHWVSFEHPDPELSFDGIATTYKSEDYCELASRSSVLDLSMYEVETIKSGFFETNMCKYISKYYVNSLISNNWIKANSNNTKFHKTTKNVFNHEVIEVEHPLKNLINIPKDKKKQLAMGIKNGQSLLENIETAGGKLSVYQVEEEFNNQ